jgi:hypothetical protein
MRNLTLDALVRILILVVIAVRMMLSAGLLNNLVGYTSGQGSIIGRFHPATYLLVLPIVLFLLRGSFRLVPPLDVAILLSMAAASIAAYNGGLNMACVIVDVGITSMIVARMLIVYGPSLQRRAIILMTSISLFNLILVIIEKLRNQAIFPRDRQELFFRPQGLFDHPLFVGYICCFLMWAVLRSPLRPARALLIGIGLWLEVVLVSVRLPLLLASLVLGLQIIATGRDRLARIGTALVAAAVLPLLASGAAAAGWLDRFFTIGLFDEQSAASRINVFDILSRMSNAQIAFGMDQGSIDAAMRILKMDAIESSFIAYTITAGMIVAILVYAANIIAFFPVIRRDLLFTTIFLSMTLGSIALSTKTATMVVVFAAAASSYGRPRRPTEPPFFQDTPF